MTTWRDIKGIYLIERLNITSTDNEPIYYVGQSVGIFNRLRQHCDGNDQSIDKEIKRFGLTNFSFSVLEIVSKTKDLNERETHWIKEFKKKGDDKLFNLSQTTNQNKYLIEPSTKKEIKSLFEEQIGRSIYAISEKYSIDFLEVIKLRKPLLKKQNLKYDTKTKNIVDQEGQIPELWQGDIVTKELGEKILKLKDQDLDYDDIAYECNISKVDLNKFIEYNDKNLNYEYAEKIKK